MIDPALLEHLIVGDAKRRIVQPLHTLALLLGIGALAAAGPTWQQQCPSFNQDKAPLAVALELAHSMDATDVAPTRLERAKLAGWTDAGISAGRHAWINCLARGMLTLRGSWILSSGIMPRAGTVKARVRAMAAAIAASRIGGGRLLR